MTVEIKQNTTIEPEAFLKGMLEIYKPGENRKWVIFSSQDQKDALEYAERSLEYQVSHMSSGDLIAYRDDEIEVFDWEKSVNQAKLGDWAPMRAKLTRMASWKVRQGFNNNEREEIVDGIGLLNLIDLLPGAPFSDPDRPIAA